MSLMDTYAEGSIAMLVRMQTVEKSETLDPAQHSWTVLAAFVEGLAGSEWTQLLDRKITWERQAVEVRNESFTSACTSWMIT